MRALGARGRRFDPCRPDHRRIPINIEALISDIPNPIYVGYRGSHVHGTYVPSNDPNSIDDIDLLSIFIGPKEHYLGFGRRDNYEKFIGEYDIVAYEIRKFFGLLLKGNPNVLHALWIDRQFLLLTTDWWDLIIENRELFSSKQAFFSFSGYARSQLRRMTHYKFEGYMGQKRKALVEQHGYDTKNASHLIRLLRMGIEFLRTGELTVTRPDARELLDIKQGKWTLERVQAEANELFENISEVYDKSPLPLAPNKAKAEELLMNIIEDFWRLSK